MLLWGRYWEFKGTSGWGKRSESIKVQREEKNTFVCEEDKVRSEKTERRKKTSSERSVCEEDLFPWNHLYCFAYCLSLTPSNHFQIFICFDCKSGCEACKILLSSYIRSSLLCYKLGHIFRFGGCD